VYTDIVIVIVKSSTLLMEVGVKAFLSKARWPQKGTRLAAGWDVYSAENILIRPGNRARISTDIGLQLPENVYVKIEGRSGLAVNKGISVIGGIVDSDFTETIQVILINHSKSSYHVQVGDRIAQFIFHRTVPVQWYSTTELVETARGKKGFGSTRS